jgi:hypothetical protein
MSDNTLEAVYDQLHADGVPRDYLNERHRIDWIEYPDQWGSPLPLIWCYDVATNTLRWSSPATIAYPDLEPWNV